MVQILSTKNRYSFYHYNELGLISKHAKVSPDSLFVEFNIKINDTVFSLNNYLENSYLLSTLSILKQYHVTIPNQPFEIRIALTDSYFLSDDYSIIDRSYSIDYLTLRQLNSNIETHYSIVKGNLVKNEELIYQKKWLN